MDLTMLHIFILGTSIVAIFLFLSGLSKNDNFNSHDFKLLLMFVIIVILTLIIFLYNYSPIKRASKMEKGLVGTAIKQPPKTFFIKTKKGEYFLINSAKKAEKIPKIGNKVVFTEDSYEIIAQ